MNLKDKYEVQLLDLKFMHNLKQKLKPIQMMKMSMLLNLIQNIGNNLKDILEHFLLAMKKLLSMRLN